MSTLREEILAKCSTELLASHDTDAIAEALSVGRTKIVETKIGQATLLNILGAVEGAALLDMLAALSKSTDPNLRPIAYAVELLKDEKLDIGSSVTRTQLDSLVTAGILPQAAVNAVKALAEKPDPISEFEVRCIAWSANGDWTL